MVRDLFDTTTTAVDTKKAMPKLIATCVLFMCETLIVSKCRLTNDSFTNDLKLTQAEFENDLKLTY
jgi:hypothetical protein